MRDVMDSGVFSGEDPMLTSAQAAMRADVTPGSWRAMVSDGTVPPADDPGDVSVPANRRSPKWKTSTVDRYVATRRVRRRKSAEEGK